MAFNENIAVSCSKIIKFKGKEILVIDPLGGESTHTEEHILIMDVSCSVKRGRNEHIFLTGFEGNMQFVRHVD